MLQIEAFAIENPCRGVCETSSSAYCKACARSREERFNWHKFSNEQKRTVLDLCARRIMQRKLRLMRQAKKTDIQPPTQLEYRQEDLIDAAGIATSNQKQYSIFSLPQFSEENILSTVDTTVFPPQQASLF